MQNRPLKTDLNFNAKSVKKVNEKVTQNGPKAMPKTI